MTSPDPWEYHRLELASTSGPDDPQPAYDVDLTPYVDGPIAVRRGRGGAFDSIQNATLSATLNNADHRFTPGNTSSPLSPNWRQGRRIRLRDTIGNRGFDLFSGCLELPEITDWAQSGDQLIQISAIDRMGCLDRGRTFVSTLGEHILDAGGDLLQAYYPLLETGGRQFRDYFGVQPSGAIKRSDTSLASLAAADPVFTPGGGTTPPGDDLPGLLLAPSTVVNAGISQALARAYEMVADYQQATATTPPPKIRLHAGEKLTIVCWADLDITHDGSQFLLGYLLADEATLIESTLISLNRNSFAATNPGLLEAGVSGDLNGGVTSTSTYTGGAPVPVAIQLSYSPNTLRFWVGASEYVASAPTGTLTDPQIIFGDGGIGPMAGSASHLQIYIGNYTRDMYLAQLDAGWTGLAYQTTGERIATLARYAGVDAAELVLDTGVGRMPKARLAGRRPGDALRDAPACEQGRLFTRGNGSLVFHDRLRTTYL